MSNQVIKTDRAPMPVGPYSQAIKSGNILFCSGQIAFDPATKTLVDDTIENETARVMDNVKAVLEAAGTSFANIVKTTIFITDMNDFGRINAVYGSYFSGMNPPARSTVQVAALPVGAHVEVECIAVL